MEFLNYSMNSYISNVATNKTCKELQVLPLMLSMWLTIELQKIDNNLENLQYSTSMTMNFFI